MARKEPLKLNVMKSMTAALEEISTVDDAYWHDLANKVYRGRTVYDDRDPTEMVTILEVPIPPEQMQTPSDARFKRGGWELFVQGWVKDDKENPTDPAYYLMEDVTQRILLEKAKVGGQGFSPEYPFGYKQITGIELGQGVVRPEDERSNLAFFWLPLTLVLVEG